jgi:hypothetical protein
MEKKEVLNLKPDIRELMYKLKFMNYNIYLAGSASYKCMNYCGDYDFFTMIEKKNEKIMYDEFIKIVNRSINNNNHFIEFKIQSKDGKKIKWNKLQDFNEKEFNDNFNNIDFYKIDLVCLVDGVYKEVSCIYQIGSFDKKKKQNEKKEKEEFKKSLLGDIKEYIKEGKYFKSLKRYFSFILVEEKHNDKEKKILDELIKIFNSDLGEKYEFISNLNALLLLLNSTDDKLLIKNIKDRFDLMLKTDNIKNIIKYIDNTDKYINEQAKKKLYLLDDVI